MRDIITPGDFATAQHHMNAGHKTAPASNVPGRTGERSTFTSADYAACSNTRSFVTCYQDILVVNIKCI